MSIYSIGKHILNSEKALPIIKVKELFGKYSSYSPNIFRRIYRLFPENFIALLKIVEYVSASKEKLVALQL